MKLWNVFFRRVGYRTNCGFEVTPPDYRGPWGPASDNPFICLRAARKRMHLNPEFEYKLEEGQDDTD